MNIPTGSKPHQLFFLCRKFFFGNDALFQKGFVLLDFGNRVYRRGGSLNGCRFADPGDLLFGGVREGDPAQGQSQLLHDLGGFLIAHQVVVDVGLEVVEGRPFLVAVDGAPVGVIQAEIHVEGGEGLGNVEGVQTIRTIVVTVFLGQAVQRLL